jgi:hypothetical protein
MKPVRLVDCGDLLNVETFSDWMLQAKNTTYQQIHDGSILVAPWTMKPLRWRRIDCEAKLGQRDIAIQQRADRVRKKYALPRPSMPKAS